MCTFCVDIAITVVFLLQLYRLQKSYQKNNLNRYISGFHRPCLSKLPADAKSPSALGGIIARLALDAVRTGAVTVLVALVALVLFLHSPDSNGMACPSAKWQVAAPDTRQFAVPQTLTFMLGRLYTSEHQFNSIRPRTLADSLCSVYARELELA